MIIFLVLLAATARKINQTNLEIWVSLSLLSLSGLAEITSHVYLPIQTVQIGQLPPCPIFMKSPSDGSWSHRSDLILPSFN